MTTQTLQDVFQRYGSKIIRTDELDSLTFEYAEMYLSPDELEAYVSAGKSPEIKDIIRAGAEKTAAGRELFLSLVTAIGDGTNGIYKSVEDDDYFVSVGRLEFMMQQGISLPYPETIKDKMMDCFARAIAEAKDHRREFKNGSLKPLTVLH